jgi:hypothetical protein
MCRFSDAVGTALVGRRAAPGVGEAPRQEIA